MYRRYGPALLRKCERILGNKDDAEDVVQTLFVELLKKRIEETTLPYLYRAATNRCCSSDRFCNVSLNSLIVFILPIIAPSSDTTVEYSVRFRR